MAPADSSSPEGAQELTIGICDQSAACTAIPGDHLKGCPSYQAPAGSRKAAAPQDGATLDQQTRPIRLPGL